MIDIITKGILPAIFSELYFNQTRKKSVFIVWTDRHVSWCNLLTLQVILHENWRTQHGENKKTKTQNLYDFSDVKGATSI